MTTITERGGVVTPDATGARIKVRVITAGQGSSGLYPAEAIESAAPHIQRGTPIYADHPTITEGYERPERSVRDLVGFFETPGAYVSEAHAVDAEATILPQWREAVAAMHEHIGMSIRASAEVDEAQGKRVIKRITSIESVDLVTKAGRGGKVLELLESSRENTAGQVTIPAEAPTPEPEPDQTESPTLGANTKEEPVADNPTTHQAPAQEAATTPVAETAQVSEAARIAQLETDVTESRNAVTAANRHLAERIVHEAFDGLNAPKATARIINQAVAEAGHDALDVDALTEAAKAEAAEVYAAHGAGTPTGLGATVTESTTILEGDAFDDAVLAALHGGN